MLNEKTSQTKSLARGFKRPESVLVVIYSGLTNKQATPQVMGSDLASIRVLMLQRNDDPNFWQSVTGSLEDNELPIDAAKREVLEETGIDIDKEGLLLDDCNYHVRYEIFEQYRWRYAPDVTHNLEHWFLLALPESRIVTLTEHTAFRWVSVAEAAEMTLSWNNQDAILTYLGTSKV